MTTCDRIIIFHELLNKILYPPGDSLSFSNGREFSTLDRDNDAWSDGNCAAYYSGANWWHACGQSNINGKYGGDRDKGKKFMCWFRFDNNHNSLKSMTLMFRQAV